MRKQLFRFFRQQGAWEHIDDDVDEVVPVNENKNPFDTVVKRIGGEITVVYKPEVKHYPHSIPNPTPIVDFILSASPYKQISQL